MKRKLLILVLILGIVSCSDDTDSGDPVIPLDADFKADKVDILTGDQITFQDLTTGDPTEWSWVFKGGTPATSTQRNPVVTYSEAGTYDVSLTVSKEGDRKTVTKDDYINVIIPEVPLEADFTADATEIIQGGKVTFEDLTSGDPTSWSWTFEGGAPPSSTEQNPVVTYNEAGNFNVSLTVSREGDEKTVTKDAFLNVSPITILISDQVFELIENAQDGMEVGTVQASTGEASVSLSYKFLSGNNNDAFEINNTTGQITVANSGALDFEVNPSFTLEVEVSFENVSSTGIISIDLLNAIEDGEVPGAGACRLDKIFTNDPVDLGFPNNGPMKSLGTVNVHVLFADFPDAPSSITTSSVFDLLEPVNNNFYQEMSYGRLNLNLIPYHSWLRLSQPSAHYAEGIKTFFGHLEFIQEAVDLADSQVDFSASDLVVVMSNPDAEEIGYGPALGTLTDFYAIKADGNNIRAGITSGYDLNHWGGIWLAHEMGHSLGLPDLYRYGGGDIHQYVGTFDIMGLISGKAPGFFAYERWLLGWLDDTQVFCHSQGSAAVELQQLETPGGIKAAIVHLSSTRALVVESRRKAGFDASLSKEGVLVYLVDTTIGRGEGPIVVKPGVSSGAMKENAPMVTGDVYDFENVRIEVLSSAAESDIVEIIVQ